MGSRILTVLSPWGLERSGVCSGPPVLEYDLEWLAILQSTHSLLSRAERDVHLPQQAKLVSEQDKQA